jgi:hypothetical protein
MKWRRVAKILELQAIAADGLTQLPFSSCCPLHVSADGTASMPTNCGHCPLFRCRPGVKAAYFCSHSSFQTLYQQRTRRYSLRAFHLVAAWSMHARCPLLMRVGVASCRAIRIKQPAYPLQCYYLLCNCTLRRLTLSPRLLIDSSDAATLGSQPRALRLPRRLS